MTGWYPYKWVCTACGAVHYYDASVQGCSRCGKNDFACKVNSERSVERLPANKRRAVLPEEPKPAEVSPSPAVSAPKKKKTRPVRPQLPPRSPAEVDDDAEFDAAVRAFMEDL